MFEPPLRVIDKRKIANLSHTQCRVLLALFDEPYASNYMLAQTLDISWYSVRNHLSACYACLGINLDKSNKIAVLFEIERSEIRDQFLDSASRKKRNLLELTTP